MKRTQGGGKGFYEEQENLLRLRWGGNRISTQLLKVESGVVLSPDRFGVADPD